MHEQQNLCTSNHQPGTRVQDLGSHLKKKTHREGEKPVLASTWEHFFAHHEFKTRPNSMGLVLVFFCTLEETNQTN